MRQSKLGARHAERFAAKAAVKKHQRRRQTQIGDNDADATTTASCGSRRNEFKTRVNNASTILSNFLNECSLAIKKRAGHFKASPLRVSTTSRIGQIYLAKKISRKVPLMSFLNSSSVGLSIKTMRGATFSASLIGG